VSFDIKCKINSRVIQKVTTTSIHALLADFAWDVFFHPSYSKDLASSHFLFLTHLKQFLCGMRMCSDEEVKKTVKDWFSELAADFYDADVQKLVTRYNKCQKLHGDYVEK
jgi:hypothetical protein